MKTINSLDEADENEKKIILVIADKFGFLNIELSNGNPHTNMKGSFYNNEGSTVHDYFTIEKEIEQG